MASSRLGMPSQKPPASGVNPAPSDQTIPDDLFSLAGEDVIATGYLERGEVLADRYEIRRLLGHGGMGEVYLANDRHVGRQVAVKVLLGNFGDTNSLTHERFVREAQVMGRLNLPGVVRVFDFGFRDGQAFLVLELLRGESVDARILSQGKLEVPEAMWIARETARALAGVHAAGYAHRDIKPSNIFVVTANTQPVVKILDFGLTRSTAEDATRLTRPGSIIGTPAYMAPATIRMKDLGALADLYSLGVTTYEMLAGRLPYPIDRDGPVVSIFRTILTTHPTPLRGAEGDIPDAVVEVVEKAISRRPEDGYQTALDMLDALEGAYALPSDSSAWTAAGMVGGED